MLKYPFRPSLRVQLMFVMLMIFILFVGILTYFQRTAEEKVFDLIQDQINSLTKAIEISMEQFHAAGATDELRLKSCIDQLKIRGVEEVSILSDQQEVILSSDPQRIGSRLSVSKNEFLIKAKIGETETGETKKLYSAFVPVISRGKLEGYIHVSMYFDDLEKLIREMNMRRLAWTLPVVGVGLILCILIAYWYTKPIPILIGAIRAIAQGRMPSLPPILQADIKDLADSLNDMIHKLEEQKTIEEKLKRAEHQSMLAQLASGIAHEIRNPLNFISLSVDHLTTLTSMDKVECRAEAGALVAKIKSEVGRVNQMISHFLDLGRELILHPIRIRADLALQEALGLNGPLLRERGIAVKLLCCDPIPEMDMDIDRMQSCFQNLIVNAAEAMPRGGNLRINLSRGDGWVHFEFRDTGEGILADDLPNIFEPYFTTKKAGIGLGLAIARRIVEAHGGTIDITSSPGLGTCAKVSIPGAGGGQ